jgi:hypothetical protein
MKFRVEHVFRNIELAAYEQLYFDEAFNEALCKSVKLARAVLKRDLTNGKLERQLRVGPDRELPPAAAKFLGSNKIEYTEFVDYTFGKHSGAWRTVSAIMTDKIESSGTFGFSAKGSGVLRWVEGEIKVKMFGVGGVIEGFIVSDVKKSYEEAAKFTQGWIDTKKAA